MYRRDEDEEIDDIAEHAMEAWPKPSFGLIACALAFVGGILYAVACK